MALKVGLSNNKKCSYQNTCDAAGRISKGIASIDYIHKISHKAQYPQFVTRHKIERKTSVSVQKRRAKFITPLKRRRKEFWL